MGAWGTGIYDNDDAADWVAELEAEGTTAIARTLTLAADSEHLEAPDGASALAAADVVARLIGGGGEVLPYCEEVVAWVAANPGATPELASQAPGAIDRVLSENSELHDLWSEDPASLESWLANISDVRQRIEHRR